jgi:hypothetical protein
VPDARIIEGPQQRAQRNDHDEGNQDATKKLELGMNAPRAEVILHLQVILAEHVLLKDVNAADGEPSERDDDRHGKPLADQVMEILRKAGDKWKDDDAAREEEDCPRRVAKIASDPPPADDLLLLPLLQDTKEDVVHYVRQHDDAAEDEDREEPVVLEVQDERGGSCHRYWGVEKCRFLACTPPNEDERFREAVA